MPNHLANEKSPYLLQHKDNPVDWYPWGDAAFNKARSENKPIFLSIGYSTCYWCHMMEKDSFEHQDVADLLNASFVSIKLDREERPDIDKIYMEAVVGLTGHGGWPMSVFLTPDLQPFFGGTFFYRENFKQLLQKLNTLWTSDRETLLSNAKNITDYLKRSEANEAPVQLDGKVLQQAFLELKQSFDLRYGGFGGAPKFPPSERLMLLLRISERFEKDEALYMVNTTLERMARGGIYDHLGGGFARYSTDEKWLVPHFEKMLYDNALLSSAYVQAYRATKNEMFRSVVTETLDYILEDMTSPEGGFYSAQDAGEVGKEGEYYVWTESEIQSLLTAEELDAIRKVYGVSARGNFEHSTNILNLQPNESWPKATTPGIVSARQKLFAARAKRQAPHLDDKVLTAWNGLMIAALAEAAQTFKQPRYLQAAQKAAQFIKTKLQSNGKLLRRYRDGDARFSGCLDDYAYLINGLIQLYFADGNQTWVSWAMELQAAQDKFFADEKGGYFYTAAEDPSVLVRKKDFADEAIPSANGVAAQNLTLLYHLTFDKTYLEKAAKLFEAASTLVEKFPTAYASVLNALDLFYGPVKEVAVVGALESTTANEMKDFLGENFLPNVVAAFGNPAKTEDQSALPIFRGKDALEGRTTIYVCENNTCKLPAMTVEKAKEQIAET